MPHIQSLLPLLRPLTAPRRAACEQLFRFSTAPKLRVEHLPATTLGASSSVKKQPKAARTSPDAPSNPNATTNLKTVKPRKPKGRKGDRKPMSVGYVPRLVGDALDTLFVTPKKTTSPKEITTKTLPEGSTQNYQTIEGAPKYHVARTTTKNLPIYTDYKRGGNLKLTTIRKITGDLSALKEELKLYLRMKDEDVKINSLTQHVIVKGHYMPHIQRFLTLRGM